MTISINLIYRITRWTLLLGGLVAFVAGVLVMIYTLAGNMPGFLNRQAFLNLGEWSDGIPTTARVVGAPDILEFPDGNDVQKNQPAGEAKSTFDNAGNFPAMINKLRVHEVKAFIQPADGRLRAWLLLPIMLNLFLFTWVAWQLSYLLKSIIQRNAFRNQNYIRIARIGYAILLVQSIFWLMNLWDPAFISPGSNQTGIQLLLESPFSLFWLITGLMLLILSRAWKDGTEMQEMQDLTI